MKSYTFKKFKKQLLPYLLSFAIVLGAFSWKAPEADAIATEAVVAAIISVAIGSGLAFAVDRMTSPEVDAYWTGQAQQWLQSIGQSYSDFVDQAEQNMSSKDGKLVLGGSFYQSIQNFLSWWRGEYDVEVGSSDVIVSQSGYFVYDDSGTAYDLFYLDGTTPVFPSHLIASSAPLIDQGSYFRGYHVTFSRWGTSEYSVQVMDGNTTIYSGRYNKFPLCFAISGHELSIAYRTTYDPFYAVLPLGISIPNSINYNGVIPASTSLSVSQDEDLSVLSPTEALPSVAFDVGASSEDDLETVIRAVFDGYRENTLVVDQELSGAGEGQGTDTDGLFGILHGISGTLSDVLDAVLSIPAALASTVTGFIGSIGNFLSGAYFGFSGIWHYVVSWVGSMAAGAAVIWSVWNGLPVAMVIPVYATAVIVIVVGLWRRFFE